MAGTAGVRRARVGARAVPRRRGVVGAVCLLMALTACSSSSSGGSGSTASSSPSASSASPSAAGGANRIQIKNFAFNPAAMTVKPGTVITVTNNDQTAHTVTATGSKSFDTGDIAPGKTVTFTAPAKAGSYPYTCSIHPFMKGTLTVG